MTMQQTQVITADELSATDADRIPSPAPAAAPSAGTAPAPLAAETEGGAETAAAPAPVAQPKWDSPDNPYYQQSEQQRQQLQELTAWRQQQEQARMTQEEQQFLQAQQQKITAFQNALQAAFVEPAAAKEYSDAFTLGLQLQNPAEQQRIRQTLTYAGERAAYALGWDTVLEHFPPNTTLATAREVVKELLKADQGQQLTPGLMKLKAQLLAQGKREQNRQGRVQSGAERIEGGVPNTAGATDERTLIEKVANRTATREEEARLAKMWAR